MPPRPRKVSVASKETSKTAKETKEMITKTTTKDGAKDGTMPPPPDPVKPLGILEPEMNALSVSLKNTLVKAGQVYRFHADASRLGVQKYAPAPPRSLMFSLGREVEKYDQICDAIEAHLLQAISVLQRDYNRTLKRLQEAEAAALATRIQSKPTSPAAAATALPSAPEDTAPDAMLGQEALGPLAGLSTKTSDSTQSSPPPPEPRGRRSSAISLSSLQRPTFPHKLDLSSASLRLAADDSSFLNSGLSSPVTLAPKSARTAGHELPDLMAAFAAADAANRPVDIDLTVPDTEPPHVGPLGVSNMSLDIDLGSSADKPIELDLEGVDIDMSNMTDLFGDESNPSNADAAVQGFFSPTAPHPSVGDIHGSSHDKPVKQEQLDMVMLDAFSGGDEDLFASLHASDTGLGNNGVHSDTLNPAIAAGAVAGPSSEPSPGTILASFVSTDPLRATPTHNDSPSHTNTGAHHDPPFDLGGIDISALPGFSPGFFNAQTSDMNLGGMEDLFNIDGNVANVDPKSGS